MRMRAEMAFASDRHDHSVSGRRRRRRHRSLGRERVVRAAGPAGRRQQSRRRRRHARLQRPGGSRSRWEHDRIRPDHPHRQRAVHGERRALSGRNLFDYVCQIFENVFTIAVAPQSKFKSVQELIAAARESGQADLWARRHWDHSASRDGELRRCPEAEIAGRAVPRRRPAFAEALLKGDIDFSASAISSVHGRISGPFWFFGRSGIRPMRMCRRRASSAPPATFRLATMVSTPPRDCRPRSRRRWRATASMPSRAMWCAR